MKYCFLLLFTLKTIYGFGMFPPNMPFHMQFDIPAFPSMSAMPFPAIFNPLEVMPRGTEEPEARGMDIDGPMGNITTKNKTEVKDGFKVTTITSNGPGFHSYIKEYQKEGNSTGNETGGLDMSKMMGGSNLLQIMQQLRNAGRPKKKEKKCKKCGKGKFCDPIFQLCRKKFAEGRTCMFQKQCGKSLRCQWGKCQKAKAGDPGTFCKGNSQCNGDACCRNTPGAFHLMCIPRQSEGAICGLKKEAFADVLYVVKRSTAPTCSPCNNGLKCADTGDGKYKRCVKDSYEEESTDELDGDNPSTAIEEDDDNENGDENNSNPLLGGDPSKRPPTLPSKPSDNDKGKEDKKEDDNDKGKEDKKEDDKDDGSSDEKNEEKKIKNDKGIAIKPAPKKKTNKKKESKKGGKS